MKFLLLLIISVLLSSSLFSATMYTLSGVDKVYPVIEISSKKVPQNYKEVISEEITNLFENLNIDHSGYSERAFAILINSTKIEKNDLVTIRLIIGEPVTRKGSTQTIFADTYSDKNNFILRPESDIEDMLEDSLMTLLDRFSEQFKEENKALEKIDINDKNFASIMNYETSYEIAVEKAKKQKKDIMLVLVANYCPWCRKFEKRVLAQNEINKLIHQKYIPLILNKEKDSFPKELNQAFSPIVYFINYETLKSYESIAGYNNREEFLYHVKKEK